MIHLIIKFLICFSKSKPPSKKGRNKTKSKSPVSSRKKSPAKNSKLSKTSEPEKVLSLENDENIIQCSEKVREWCHIEYCLFEDVLPLVELTVVSWGAAAKIYFEDDWRALKTVTIDDCVWVHFTMVHKISKLSDEQVSSMKENVINFKFSQDLKKMGSNVANDWPKTFAVCTCKNSGNMVEKKMFCELRQTDPSDDTHNSEFAHARLDNYKMKNVGSNNQIFMANLLQLAPCNQMIENKIKTIMKTMPTTTLAEESGGKKEKNKKVKGGKKMKNSIKSSVQDKTKLSLNSGLLIAGKTNVCVESENISPSLRYAATFTSASKVLTDEQDLSFVPLSVTIEEVTNIPRKHLEDMNVQFVYAQYELAPLLEEVQTSKVALRSDGGSLCHAEFDDTRLWFISEPRERERYELLTQRPSVLQLIESLLTRRLVVKLYGVKSSVEERVVEPCVFGQRATDKFISTPGHPMYLEFREPHPPSKEVLLGSACFNLVQLVKGLSTYEGSSLLSSAPVSSWSPTCDWNQLTEYLDTDAERAQLMKAFSVRGALPDHVLFEHFTSVKVKVTVGCRLSNLSEKELILMPNVLHRVIVVFKNYMYACAVVDRITSTNLTLGDPANSASVTSASVSNLVLRYTNDPIVPMRSGSIMFNPSVGSRRTLVSIRGGGGLPSAIVQQIKDLRRMLSCYHRSITGFCVKHAEESLLVLESIPYVTNYMMEPLHGLLPTDGRVVYDNSVFFTQRLYIGFTGNVHEIELPVSLDALLARTAPYLSENAQARTQAHVAAHTLLLLDLLRRVRTVNDASVNQLFPSSDQLIAFQMEYSDGRLPSLPPSQSSNATLI